MASNPRTKNGAARRKLIARVKREERICWLCGDPVDLTLGFQYGLHGAKCRKPDCTGCVPHPMRAEVDEIVPVSLGGSPYDRKNTHLSHRLCNQRRGNKPPAGMLPPIQPLRTSREW